MVPKYRLHHISVFDIMKHGMAGKTLAPDKRIIRDRKEHVNGRRELLLENKGPKMSLGTRTQLSFLKKGCQVPCKHDMRCNQSCEDKVLLSWK